MRVSCKKCRSEIPATDVDIKRAIAKCTSCNEIFDFSDQLSAVPARSPMAVSLPKNMEVRESASGFTIVRRWFSPKVFPMAGFCLLWNGFLFFWYDKAFESGNLIAIFFPFLHVAVGAGLTYSVLAGFLNKTYIGVSRQLLAVVTSPLPFFNKKTLNPDDVEQLYSKEKVTRGRDSTTSTYEVHIVTKSGKDIKLVSGLQQSEQALYIEQEIEKYLEIKDRRVRGELPR